jgi:hypothetical protein
VGNIFSSWVIVQLTLRTTADTVCLHFGSIHTSHKSSRPWWCFLYTAAARHSIEKSSPGDIYLYNHDVPFQNFLWWCLLEE